jgi:tryptophan synthase beta subunit
MGRDPLAGGKDNESLDAFARLFQERGVPPAADMLHAVAGFRAQEGLEAGG